jgi:hypothetical protein
MPSVKLGEISAAVAAELDASDIGEGRVMLGAHPDQGVLGLTIGRGLDPMAHAILDVEDAVKLLELLAAGINKLAGATVVLRRFSSAAAAEVEPS